MYIIFDISRSHKQNITLKRYKFKFPFLLYWLPKTDRSSNTSTLGQKEGVSIETRVKKLPTLPGLASHACTIFYIKCNQEM